MNALYLYALLLNLSILYRYMEKLARFPADFENMSEIPRMVG